MSSEKLYKLWKETDLDIRADKNLVERLVDDDFAERTFFGVGRDYTIASKRAGEPKEDLLDEEFDAECEATGETVIMGGLLYKLFFEELKKENKWNVAIIIPAAQSKDGKHKIYVTPNAPEETIVRIANQIREEHPKAFPYVRFIGNPEDNPYIIHI